jgi:tetratricopeptide (TPR) repeat protein
VLWREFLENWANDGEGSKVLITTREEPNLPKLRFSRYELCDGLEDAEGAAVLRDFGLLGTEAELVVVSQRVGGIPLSLMLIVGLLCNDYEEEPHVRFLPKDLFGIEGAHRLGRVTTEAVFRASFERLEPRLQSLLMAVSVFAKPFNHTMAAAMIADEEVTDRDLLLLKKRGFVLAESGCYRFQPQIQELVQRQAADLLELHRRAINFYLTLCEAKPTLDPRYDTLEDANPYLQVFHHCCKVGAYEIAFYMLRNDLNGIDDFLTLSGYYVKMVDLYTLLVSRWQLNKLQQWKYAASLNSLGIAHYSLGHYQEAIMFHQQALNIEREIGNKQGEANVLGNLGNSYDSLGQYQQAINFHQQSLSIEREIGNKQGEANSLGSLGIVFSSIGQYKESIIFYKQSLEIEREIGNKQGEAHSLGNLGNTYHYIKHYQEAISLHQKSLEISRLIGDRRSESISLGNLGNIYHSLKKYNQSIEFHLSALLIAKEIGDQAWEAGTLCNLGDTYNSLRHYQQAINLHKKSLEISRMIGNRHIEATSLCSLGNTYNSLGQYQQAIASYQQSLKIQQAIGDKRGEAISFMNLGEAYHHIWKFKEGFVALNRANKLLQELKIPIPESYTKRFILLIRFAQRGKWQIALCFCIGLFAFPLFLAYLVALLLWRLIKEKGKR